MNYKHKFLVDGLHLGFCRICNMSKKDGNHE